MLVYISCPMTVPQTRLDTYARLLRSWGAVVMYWQRGTNYSDENLRAADAVVVVLPNNAWTAKISELPQGTRGEIGKSIGLRKPIYIAYSTIDNVPRIFNSELWTDQIGGKAGTRDDFEKIVRDSVKHLTVFGEEDGPAAKKSVDTISPGAYCICTFPPDKRLLFRLRK